MPHACSDDQDLRFGVIFLIEIVGIGIQLDLTVYLQLSGNAFFLLRI